MTHPSGIEIRPARPDELPAAARVYLLAEDDALVRQSGELPRAGTVVGDEVEAAAEADLRIAAADRPEGVLVALDATDVVGVAAWRAWEHWWFLDYLFVLPSHQGRSIGRALLERAHAEGSALGCTYFSLFASRDPRALRRYLALGLQPQPPVVDLRAAPGDFRPPASPPADGLVAQPLGSEGPDPAVLGTIGDLDRVVRGARREGDLRRWLADGSRGALLTDWTTGKPAGYFLISPTPTDSTGLGRIGPIVALDLDRLPAILTRALAATAPFARQDLGWRVTLPGQNRTAIAPLFAAGFRPSSLENYLASGSIGRWDRYVMRSEDEV